MSEKLFRLQFSVEVAQRSNNMSKSLSGKLKIQSAADGEGSESPRAVRIIGDERASTNSSGSSAMSSPRDTERLRADPKSWLSKMETIAGGEVRVSFLREVRTLLETTPRPFMQPSSSMAFDDATMDSEEYLKSQLRGMRRVEAFLETKDGRIFKSPQKCITQAEAIESAAYEFLLLACHSFDPDSDPGSGNPMRRSPSEMSMRSASSPGLSSSASEPCTPRPASERRAPLNESASATTTPRARAHAAD